RRLTNMVSALAAASHFPICTIFSWEVHAELLTLRYINEEHPALPLGMKVSGREEPWRNFIVQKNPLLLRDPLPFSQPLPATSREIHPLHFLVAFPIIDDIFFYGALAFFDSRPRPVTHEEERLLAIVCRQLAGTIRNAQISLQGKKRIAELSTLHAIGTTVSSTSELGELLNQITLSSTKVLQADGALLHLLDEEAGSLKVVSSFGLEPETDDLAPLSLGEKTAGLVAKTGEPILVRDAQTPAFSFREFPQGISSVVCVPLIFKSRTIGTLTLFSIRIKGRQEKIFDEEDKNLLATMASQIAMAIENAIILQRAELLTRDKERMVRELSLLYEVSRSMLTTFKLDQLARIILLGVTLKN
ncbi:MAG: GAF domain-containing protein, partial [Deltaproteobacteria bacterium]|nr:GAF domain-containing protein [Deltaproteobacteria bacterium]